MDPEEYDRIFDSELTHWWYLGMQTITRALLDRFVSAQAGLKILDAGCGTGGTIYSTLAAYGNATGLDISPLALKGCQARKLSPLVFGSVMGIPFLPDTFDLVTSFDVLYTRTVPDVIQALRECARVLVPGGRLLLRLPAYNWLRGHHDTIVWTARQFTARSTARLLRQSGFTVEHCSYANTLLFPLALIKRVSERFLPTRDVSSDVVMPAPIVNGLLRVILSLEAPLVAHTGLPFGLSVYALAQKSC